MYLHPDLEKSFLQEVRNANVAEQKIRRRLNKVKLVPKVTISRDTQLDWRS